MSFVPSRQGQTQIMLRLPSEELGARLRELLQRNELEGIEFTPEAGEDEITFNAVTFVSHRFSFKLDDKTYPARLTNLPT